MRAGVATDTIVESTRIMKNPTTSDQSAGQACGGIVSGFGRPL